MATKVLLDQAVKNTTSVKKKGFLDFLFTHWFNRLVYPQIWEDPVVDIEALQLNSDSRIVTISSGGCNVLNYLVEQPHSISVVDLNETHLALLRLKLAALKHFETYEQFFEFFGEANLRSNLDLYTQYLKPNLDEETLNYWESRPAFYQPKRINMFTNNFYRHGLLGSFIGMGHFIARMLGYNLRSVMDAKTMQEQAQIFDEKIGPVFDTRLVKFLSNRPVVLYSLGIPPSQFDCMAEDAGRTQVGMHDLLRQRLRTLACDFPLETNYFAWQAFARQYDTKQRQAIPEYLKEDHFDTLKAQLDKVDVNHITMTDYLAKQPDASMDGYVLLDAMDWMDEAQLTELWEQIERTASPKARLICRSSAEECPVDSMVPSRILSKWSKDDTEGRAFLKRDRSSIYGGFHLYKKA